MTDTEREINEYLRNHLRIRIQTDDRFDRRSERNVKEITVLLSLYFNGFDHEISRDTIMIES